MTTYFNSVPLEWGTAVGCAELLREQCEHPGQQDHGGHHTDRQAVRNLQVRVESVLDIKKNFAFPDTNSNEIVPISFLHGR